MKFYRIFDSSCLSVNMINNDHDGYVFFRGQSFWSNLNEVYVYIDKFDTHYLIVEFELIQNGQFLITLIDPFSLKKE